MLLEPVKLQIGCRTVRSGGPLFVIAEIGLNHGGSIDRAIALVDAAADAGADAVKLQTIVAADLVAPGCPAPDHVRAASLVEFFETFQLDEDAHAAIVSRARARGLQVMATPLSMTAVPMLERIGIDAYKIASGDLTWHQLISACAATRKPIVISTGLALMPEIAAAVAVARQAGARAIALLHCVSAYPVPRGQENLRAIRTLADVFDLPVGLSDHGDDTFAVPIALAQGAVLYERHLVLDDDVDAVDRAVSSTPGELATAIAAARRTHAALGHGRKASLDAEGANHAASRRSLCAARDLCAGHVLAESDLIALRPATGLAPKELPRLVGMRLTREIARGAALQAQDVQMVGVGRARAS